MALNALSGISGSSQPLNVKVTDAKLQAAIANIITGNTKDVANVALASQLQSQNSSLRQLSGNVVQNLALTQVASGGADAIQGTLIQLQSLAQEAQSPALNNEVRKQLNQQFQKLTGQIDQIVSDTSFGGLTLLDGSLSGNAAISLDTILSSNSSDGETLSISNLSTTGLLDVSSDILSVETATSALGAINSALSSITATRSEIGAFQGTLNFAAANIDTAILNQDAALSSLSDSDVTVLSSLAAQGGVQGDATTALAAQANRLNPILLNLIG